MKPQRSDRLTSWWRTFAVQGSWNYRSLVGCGIAYGMLPLLRRIHAGDPVRLRDSVERNMRSFNGHPYLCAMAVGALARLEYDGVDVQRLERFRTALRGPLGTLGDRIIWVEWRPFCLLVAIVAYSLGLGPFFSTALFLALYNVGHLYLRGWAFRSGWEAGLDVGRVLRESWLDRATGRLWPANMVLLGAASVLVGRSVLERAGATGIPWFVLGVGIVLALLAFRWPRRGGSLAVLLLVSVPIVWVLISLGIVR
jgi:PTS system mannose-specific IID component